MTTQEQEQIRKLISHAPKSLWGYLVFITPILVVLFGAAVQFVLLAYFKSSRVVDFDVCIRYGKSVELLWDNQLVKEAVLAVTACITASFGLLAYLAYKSFRQIQSLSIAAKELGIELSQTSK